MNTTTLIYALVGLNALTLLMMVLDKFFAGLKTRRIPESTFYVLSLVGGSIGVLLGMYLVRHKTRKLSFQMPIIVILLAQFTLFILIYKPDFAL